MAHSAKFDGTGTSILVSHFNQNHDPAKQTEHSSDQGSTNGGHGNGFGAAPVAAGSNREQVMIEFQQSMLQITKSFLEAQQQVMMAYLGSPASGQVNQAPLSISQPAYEQGAVHEYQSAPQTMSQPQLPQTQAYTAPQFGAQPGYAPQPGNVPQTEYVEPAPAATVEYAYEAQSAPYAYQAFPETNQVAPTLASSPETELQPAVSAVAQPPSGVAAAKNSAESDSPTLSAEALVETLIDIVSDRTGYPKEMLDPTLDMEADLGIDSIKKIEILNALRKLLPAAKQAQIEESMERIATIKTLAGVMDWIRDEFGDQAATAAAAPVTTATTPGASTATTSASRATTSASTATTSASTATASTAPSVVAPTQTPNAAPIPSPSAIKPKARLNGSAVSQPEPGVVAFTVSFGPDNDLYLNDHKFNQVPVMPMAAALELMAAAACSVYPGFTLSSVENLDIPAGITFESGARELTVVVRNAQAAANGADSDHVTVSTAVTTGGVNGRVHFKAKIELSRSLNGNNGTPSAETLAVFPAVRNPAGKLPTIDEIYGKLMFHGPLMQGICQVTELGEDGISGVLRPSDIKRCVRSANGDDWIIDPILLDSAMQLAGIWARHYHDIMVLPTGFTRLRLYKNGANGGSHANLTGKIHVPVEYDQGQLRCDLAIYDDGKPVMIVEGLGGVGSKSFNKLAAQS